MKVKDEATKIRKLTVKDSEYTEAVGFVATVVVDIEVRLADQKQLLDTNLKNAIHQLLVVGRAAENDDGPNTYVLKAKRKFGAIEHTFSTEKNEVVCVGTPKYVTYHVVEGEFYVRYAMTTLIAVAHLAALATFMDSEVQLTTTSAQQDLFEEAA